MFGDDPGQGLRQLRRRKEEDPDAFRETAARFLADTRETRFSRLLLHLLREDDDTLESVLLHPKLLTNTQSIQLAILACRIDPKLQTVWAAALPDAIGSSADDASTGSTLRRLEILAACSDPLRLLPLVQSLCNHSDASIRAIAVGLAARLQPESGLPPGLSDTSTRVRASAIQAMWGRRDAAALSRFEAHSTQPHHREAINALVGLHRAGLLSARQSLMDLAAQPDARVAAAALWAIGHSGDPRLFRFLQHSIANADSPHRMGLLKAARQFRKNLEKIEAQPALQLKVRTLEALGLGRVQIETLLVDAHGKPCSPDEVLPVHFLLSDGESALDHSRIQIRGTETSMDLLFLLPADLGGEDLKQLHRAIQTKRRDDYWSAQSYPVTEQESTALSSSPEFVPHLDRVSERLQPPRPAGASMEAAMDRLISSFPQRPGARHLVILTSPDLPADTAPARIWIDRFQRYAVIPHLVVRAPLTRAATNGWRRLCLETDGSYTECPASENLGECVQKLLLSFNLSIRINCHMGRTAVPDQSSIPLQIEFLSPIGSASTTIAVPA